MERTWNAPAARRRRRSIPFFCFIRTHQNEEKRSSGRLRNRKKKWEGKNRDAPLLVHSVQTVAHTASVWPAKFHWNVSNIASRHWAFKLWSISAEQAVSCFYCARHLSFPHSLTLFLRRLNADKWQLLFCSWTARTGSARTICHCIDRHLFFFFPTPEEHKSTQP